MDLPILYHYRGSPPINQEKNHEISEKFVSRAQYPAVLRAIISLQDFFYSRQKQEISGTFQPIFLRSACSLKVSEKILDLCSLGLYNVQVIFLPPTITHSHHKEKEVPLCQ